MKRKKRTRPRPERAFVTAEQHNDQTARFNEPRENHSDESANLDPIAIAYRPNKIWLLLDRRRNYDTTFVAARNPSWRDGLVFGNRSRGVDSLYVRGGFQTHQETTAAR